jgi:hypothetical protein
MRNLLMKNFFLSIIVCLPLVSIAAPGHDQLQRGFQRPPDDVRPWVYWVWMDGNLSKEGITSDLEAMRSAGIGGVLIMEVNVGVPQGSVKFMSPAWRECFTHVVVEGERLGIQVTLLAGPGWTGSGGPWVTPEQSMQHLVTRSRRVRGPAHFADTLGRPARLPAFFGDGLLPSELEKAKNEFYRDVAVLAYPTPAVPDTIAEIDEKAFYVRSPYSSWRGTRPFLPSLPVYPAPLPGSVINPDRVMDISAHLDGEGRLQWDVPPGDWTIMRLGRTTTGANSRPAPVPGLGLECDKLDTAALNAHFENFVGTLLRDIGPRAGTGTGGLKRIHMDSWEMGSQNWTPALRREFQRRRGYDFQPYLPTLSGAVVGSRGISERFLWDFRQTINEMMLEYHASHLKELGRRHGLSMSIEPYDMTPVSDMSLGSLADVPQCEFWLYGFNTSFSVMEATSIAHTCGRPVVAAEAFTSSDEEHWQAHPGSMKALGDWAFCAGVNQIAFHRYQHQPWLDLQPGMTMGPYGVHWERTQTWWDMVPAYHQYLSRCQYLLRQGLPVADVCYLVPEGAPQVFRPPSSATRGGPPDRLGYNFDGCAPDVFLERMGVKDGKLFLPDGMEYRVLVLPERETMTPAMATKVKQLVEGGATVIGPPPQTSPGLADFPRCDEAVRKLSSEVWGNCDGVRVNVHPFGKGRVIWHRRPNADSVSSGNGGMEQEQYSPFKDAVEVLSGSGVLPDFESDVPLRYTHRSLPGAQLYFVANPDSHRVTVRCTFRTAGNPPELWDPVSGEIRSLPRFAEDGGRTFLTLEFEPFQSFFVVFDRGFHQATPMNENFPHTTRSSEVDGPWNVTFDPKRGGPGEVQFAHLEDWSRRPEEGIRFYSGMATYRSTFALPPAAGGKGKPVWLDLGTVKNICRVRLNGRELGTVWCAPWRVEISSALSARTNLLEITVANLWPNRLIGDERTPSSAEYGADGNLLRWPEWIAKGDLRPSPGRYTFATWRHFTKETPLLPSGLLGPVQLLY